MIEQSGQQHDFRQKKALQEELKELIGVVTPASLVDLLLERAFELRATDIHLDPSEKGLRVRLRVDGVLHDVALLPVDVTSHIVTRIKLMANMDITERRLAQDGHISNFAQKHQRDIRVGGGPTVLGERLVLRLMPTTGDFRYLEDLGLEEDQVQKLKSFVSMRYGMVLSVGPVGSGKSTTMYSCLELLNEPSKCLITIEDPVERRIEGVNQIHIDPKIDFNFVDALRGVLRQDPDIIMIGEIRDPETAHIGVRAGLTGVSVLSTLHANDTTSAIDVFRDYGVPPTFIADSLRGIISQRLLRRVCSRCSKPLDPDETACNVLGISPDEARNLPLSYGTGCDACFHSGYFGRTGVFEMLKIDPDIRRAIIHGMDKDDLVQLAQSKGMNTLEESAKKKVRDGVTTVEEMFRVLTSYPGL